jgi:hypothetical protein
MTLPHRIFRPAVALAGLVLAVSLCSAALAQTTPAPAQTTPAPAQPAQPPEITPSHLLAARDLVVSSGLSRSFGIFVPQMEAVITESLTTTRPEIADDLTAVMKQIDPEFEAKQDEIVLQAARAFATRMTEQELKEAVAFFTSPAGKKYVNSEPPILDFIVNGIQYWRQRTTDEMMARVKAEMKKKGHDL